MSITQNFIEQAKLRPARIVYPEGHESRILSAASKAKALGIANPIILGNEKEIMTLAQENNINLDGIPILPVNDNTKNEKYAAIYAENRKVSLPVAKKVVQKPLCFAGMMVKTGDADGTVCGAASTTAAVISSASLTIGFAEGLSTPSSFFIMMVREHLGIKNKPFIFADCAVNIDPTPRQLAEIAIASAQSAVALLGIEPRVAFLSFSTKGSASHALINKVVEAVHIAKELAPNMLIDGELQGDAAVNPTVAAKKVKESKVAGSANVLIFPDLNSGNICYKLVQHLGGAVALGPMLQGFAKPVSDLSRGATVDDIVGVTAITVLRVERNEVNL